MKTILLKDIINQENSYSLFRSCIEGNEFNLEKIEHIYETIKDNLKVKVLDNVMHNINSDKNPALKTLLFEKLKIKIEESFKINPNELKQNIIDNYWSSFLLNAFDESEISIDYKSETLNECINQKTIYNDHNFYFKNYKKYNLHFTNENYSNWGFLTNQEHVSLILLDKKFINEFNQLNNLNKTDILRALLLTNVVKTKFINTFLDKIDLTSLHNDLQLLTPNQFAFKPQLVKIYQKSNVDIGEVLKKTKLMDFGGFCSKENLQVINEIIKKTNSQIKPYSEATVTNYMMNYNYVLHNNWLDFLNLVDFKNKKPLQENFIKLTSKIASELKNGQAKTELLKLIPILEKQVLVNKIEENITPTKKIKI